MTTPLTTPDALPRHCEEPNPLLGEEAIQPPTSEQWIASLRSQ